MKGEVRGPIRTAEGARLGLPGRYRHGRDAAVRQPRATTLPGMIRSTWVTSMDRLQLLFTALLLREGSSPYLHVTWHSIVVCAAGITINL